MADAVTLILTMTKHGTDIGTDHEGEYASLGQGDSLKVQIDSSFTGTKGIERIDIYTDEATKNAGAPSAVYWPGQVGTLQTRLTFGSTTNGTKTTAVTMTSAEDPATNDIFFYKVTADAAKLDPELMNKSGGGKGSGEWVRITALEAALIEVIRREVPSRAY